MNMKNQLTLTRADIVQKLMMKIECPYEAASNLLETFLHLSKEALANEGKLKLPNFGNFEARQKKKRVGRNPKTKEECIIAARKSISFHSSKTFKNVVCQKKSNFTFQEYVL